MFSIGFDYKGGFSTFFDEVLTLLLSIICQFVLVLAFSFFFSFLLFVCVCARVDHFICQRSNISIRSGLERRYLFSVLFVSLSVSRVISMLPLLVLFFLSFLLLVLMLRLIILYGKGQNFLLEVGWNVVTLGLLIHDFASLAISSFLFLLFFFHFLLA